MVKSRQYVVTKRFQGLPKLTDFQIVEEELPPLNNGEIRVRTEYVSLDAYLYFDNPAVRQAFELPSNESLPYEQSSFQVGVVEETKNPKFPVGTRVVSHRGWRDYYVADPNAAVEADRYKIRKIPELKELPPSLAVGAVGMPGVTALVGFHKTKARPGETVVVSGAAGAVGSLVGQIARIKGCTVIGLAGSDNKVQRLERELGFNKALNYKTEDIGTALKKAAPRGVDVYFDNVGGEISSSVMRNMNVGGRVCVCGSMSCYTEGVLPMATVVQPAIAIKQLEIKGFIVWDSNYGEWERAFDDLVNWIKSGQIKAEEHVTEGFDNIPRAFIGMFTGENFGKAVVKI